MIEQNVDTNRQVAGSDYSRNVAAHTFPAPPMAAASESTSVRSTGTMINRLATSAGMTP